MIPNANSLRALLLVPALAACSSGEDDREYLGLARPADGFQIRSVGAEIEPGGDVEYCEIAELPGSPDDVYYVTSIELANAPSSHHLFVSSAVPGSPADERLRSMNVGDRVPCFSASTAFPEAGIETIFGIQKPYGRLDFPEGVGREFRGGQRIVFDYHYLNTGSAPIAARSAFNFHVTDSARIRQVARLFGFYNWTIDTPPKSTSSFTAECHFNQDVKLAGITRHTHRWGTDFEVSFSGGPRHGEHVWTSRDWEHEVDRLFPEPLLMRAGEGFRFRCDFNNTEDHVLRFGPSARDEMCILFGLAWDAGSARTIRGQSCDITWIDEQGVGHPTAVEPGFPPPTETELLACQFGSAKPGEPLNECASCRCDNCAKIIMECALDKACNPILQCVQSTSCGDSCASDCQEIIDQNASAVGLITRVASCVNHACPSCSIEGEGNADEP